MKGHGLPYHVNAMPRPDGTFGLSVADAEKIRANGHEIASHFDFHEEPITAYECGCKDKTRTDFPTLRQAIDLAGRYHLTMNMFYHPIYVAEYPACRLAIEEALRYLKERQIRPLHMGNDGLYHWWKARSEARVSAVTLVWLHTARRGRGKPSARKESIMTRTSVRQDKGWTRRFFFEAAAGVAAGGLAWEAGPLGKARCEGAAPRPKGETKPLVLFQSGEVWEEVFPVDGTGEELAKLGLISKGVSRVRFQGKAYSIEREGLYRFMFLPESLRNVISLRSERSLVSLLMAISALQVHGNRYDRESLDSLKKKMLVEPWVCITCGTIARLTRDILASQGYKTRMIGSSTTEKPNYYNDGHAMFEVHWPEAGKWILVDADMGLLFKDGGVFLGAQEVADRVQQDRRPEFFYLAQKAAVLDPYFLGPDGYNYALEFRWLWGTPEGKWRWYRRVMQRVAVIG